MKFKMVVIVMLLMGVTMKTNASSVVATEKPGALYDVRSVTKGDISALRELYLATAGIEGGLARRPEEITEEYITDLVDKSISSGLMLIATSADGMIIGAVSKFRPGPLSLNHTLSGGTTVTHPAWFGKGVATALWTSFLSKIVREYADIARIELFVRASNDGAIKVYTRVGFVEEGRLKNRIVSKTGVLEDDLIMGWLNPAFDSGTILK